MENRSILPEVAENTSEKPLIFGVILSPNVQFEKIRKKPIILFPLIIVLITALIGTILISLSVDYIGPMVELGVGEQEAESMANISMITGIIGGVAGIAFSIIFTTLIYWIIVKVAKTGVAFKPLFSLTTFVSFVLVIGLLLNGMMAYIAGLNPEQYVTSLNSLIGADGILGGILGGIEIFQIWAMILTAIGLNKVAELSKGVSWTVAIIFFLIHIGQSAISGLLSGMIPL